MKAVELREMSDEQLTLTLKETCEGLFRLRLQAETERLDAPSELLKHRRLVARIKTVQSQRQQAAAAKAAKENPPVKPAPAAPKAAAPKADAKGAPAKASAEKKGDKKPTENKGEKKPEAKPAKK
jgi:large subunit ribosomal protein L29